MIFQLQAGAPGKAVVQFSLAPKAWEPGKADGVYSDLNPKAQAQEAPVSKGWRIQLFQIKQREQAFSSGFLKMCNRVSKDWMMPIHIFKGDHLSPQIQMNLWNEWEFLLETFSQKQSHKH